MSKAIPPAGTMTLIEPELLLLAYRSGIFPMAEHRDNSEVLWIEPRERAIIPLGGLHVSHSLARTLRKERYTVTCDRAFADVIEACAAPRPDPGGAPGESWISRKIAASYCRLHELGHAHSVECWQEDRLVGGLYGVAFDRVFCGESMFSRAPDASKVALCWLVAAMRAARMELLDCQFMTPHLASLGAVSMPQAKYLEYVHQAMRPRSQGAYATLPDGYEALLVGASSPGKVIAQCFTHTS